MSMHFVFSFTGEIPFDTVEMRFRFHSNFAISRSGFYIKVKQLECINTHPQTYVPLPSLVESSCSGVFQQSAFQIFSPNYPQSYPNIAICHYVVKKSRPDICQLQMMFDKFEVEASSNCTADYLEIMGTRICGTIPDGRQSVYSILNPVSLYISTNLQHR